MVACYSLCCLAGVGGRPRIAHGAARGDYSALDHKKDSIGIVSLVIIGVSITILVHRLISKMRHRHVMLTPDGLQDHGGLRVTDGHTDG
jgi:hypothetical protein